MINNELKKRMEDKTTKFENSGKDQVSSKIKLWRVFPSLHSFKKKSTKIAAKQQQQQQQQQQQ